MTGFLRQNRKPLLSSLVCALIGALGVSVARAESRAQPKFEAVDVQFFGDFYAPKRVFRKTGSSGEDPRFLAELKPLLESARANIVNFEGVAGSARVPYEMKHFVLRMPAEVGLAMKAAGITHATLANNHTLDFGFDGLWQSWQILEDAGIEVAGSGRNLREALQPLYIPTPHKTICVMPISRALPESFWAQEDKAGTPYLHFTGTKDHLKTCVDAGFFTVAAFHWSSELMTKPKAYQIKLAKLLIDHGVDLVIGHHPHVLQPVEIYKGKLIAYSLGNFAFGTLTKGRKASGMALRLRLLPQNRVHYEMVALNVDNNVVKFVPQILPASELLAVIPKGCKQQKYSFRCQL